MDIQIFHGQKNFSLGQKIKFVMVVLLLSTTSIVRSQTQFSLGASVGYDKSFHQFDFMPLTNTDVSPDYNFGIDGAMKIKDWLRVKAELHYSNLGFTRYWESGSTDADAINKSKVAISNIDISPLVELRFLKVGNLDMFATTGFRFEIQSGKWEKSFTNSGEEMDYDHVMDKYNESKAGVVGGLFFKYNISPEFAFTLSPQYTYFFKPLYYQNKYDDEYKYQFLGILDLNKTNLRRFSFNVGVEWSF
jgi:hypothetical protein